MVREPQADPHVEVQVKGDRFKATARDATAEEKAEMWPTMTTEWPAYDDYQTKTEREIPIVVLERADGLVRAAVAGLRQLRDLGARLVPELLEAQRVDRGRPARAGRGRGR